MKIKFTKDIDGHKKGETIDVTPGIADAFVQWRRCAEIVEEMKPDKLFGVKPDPEFAAKALLHAPHDKMMRSGDLETKDRHSDVA